MTVLLTLMTMALLVLIMLNVTVLGMLIWMHYKCREMRKQIDVIFDAAANSEEYLAAIASDSGFSFSAN